MELQAVRVRKRDGHEESFDTLKLVESARSALLSVGADPSQAESLLSDVLRRIEPDDRSMVESSDLAFYLEGEFMHTDTGACLAYREYRRARNETIRSLRVHVRQGVRSESSPWDRERLTLSLVRDRFIERSLGRRLACQVERRFAAGGWIHLTGRFVSSAADNEARAMGLPAEPLGSPRIGLERSHLRAWLGGDCLPLEGAGGPMPAMSAEGSDPRSLLGGELLARFALEDVLTPAEAKGLESGAFALPHLSDWMRLARVRLQPESGESQNSFWRRVASARESAAEVQAFVPLTSSSSGSPLATTAPEWLLGTHSRLRLSTSDPSLALSWAKSGFCHSLSLTAYLEASQETQQELLELRQSSIVWHPVKRSLAEEASSGRKLDGLAVVNVAQAALRAGSWNETAFQQHLAEATLLAAHAVKRLAERAGSSTRPSICLIPAGLKEAWVTLRPSVPFTDERVRRFILNLRSLFDRSAREVGLLPEHVYAPHTESAGVRLAEIDAIPGVRSYFCGWRLDAISSSPTTLDFDAAPWLEFGVAQAQSMSMDALARHLPRRGQADS